MKTLAMLTMGPTKDSLFAIGAAALIFLGLYLRGKILESRKAKPGSINLKLLKKK
jgi:hypothetical protein